MADTVKKCSFLFVTILFLAWTERVKGDGKQERTLNHLLDGTFEEEENRLIRQLVPPGERPRRVRRATTAPPYRCNTPSHLTRAQQAEVVRVHNSYRGSEPAANGIIVTWDDKLANLAQGWANKCDFKHQLLTDCNGDSAGQNIYMKMDPDKFTSLNMTEVIGSWRDEKVNYNLRADSCKPGQMCGHYTQVVSARSTQVGCASAYCPNMKVNGIVWKNALVVACDYSPPGNMYGEKIYIPGRACSKCDSEGRGGGYKCVNNLCVPCTPRTDSACKCGAAQKCINGGSWSPSTCSCNCPKRFFGQTCEDECTCKDAQPEACANAWLNHCKDIAYKDFMTDNCISTCKFKCSLPPSCRK